MTANLMITWVIAAALSIAAVLENAHSDFIDGKHDFPTEVPFRNIKESLEENEVPAESNEEGWSAWGAWSSCSRSCNGGITYQMRKCEQKIGCDGEAKKFKICNMQPCPDSTDFRATQCAAYNHKPYRGRLYEWLPYQDPENPCSLTCQAGSHNFVAKLSPSVRDGTRCRDGALDMCVDGKCMMVGCDLQLGSSKKVDECGVCGGDGSTCRRPLYVWGKTPFSPCSVSCGGGYQMSRPTCLNKANDKEVDDRLCDGTGRPVPEIKECNPEKCPPVWVTDSWSPCSASCGGGRQSRQVHCAVMGSDGIRAPVPVEQCLKPKPLTERPCNLVPCPKWVTGPWSGCSVTCGKGQKTRSVACSDAKEQHSEDCDIEEMPATKQPCDSGLICVPSEDPGTYLFSDIFKGSQEDAPPRNYYWSYPVPSKSKEPNNYPSIEPSYVVGEWGPCSASCGQGFKQRTVDCKIFLEFSRTVAKLQDNECPGTRPTNMESCFITPCSYDMNKQGDRKKTKGHVGIEVTYSWRSNGFTPCSASCLGGTRESVIQCVRDHDMAVVKSTQCDIAKKPDAITQTCNDQPCPPKWNISEFTACSKSCGGGLMTRKVQCLHEILRGAANTLVVDDSKCPQPPPREQLFCNNFDCPQRWKPGNWSKCSKSCGGGVKIRKIHCMMQKAFGQEVELSPSNCSRLTPPKTQKLCNMKACPTYEDAIVPSHQSYVQQHPQRRVFLKVGGRAVVFAETNIKIRCPSKNVNKTGILWYKNDQQITSSKRLKVSMKGALRIRRINLKDSGKYTCVSGYSKADIFITVKPLPPRLDEERTIENLKPVTVPGTKDRDRTSEEVFNRGNPVVDNKNLATYSNNKQKPSYPVKIDFGTNEDTFEDNRKQYQYKTGMDSSQNSHQDFGNKAKPFSTEDSTGELSTSRIPLYLQVAQQSPKSVPVPQSTEKPAIKPLDSDELVPNRGSQDFDKNRQKVKTKPYSPTDEKSPNQVIPPRYGDTWKQTYDGAQRAKNKPKDVWDRNDGALFSDQEELNVGTPHGGKGFPNQPAHSGASSPHSTSHIKNLLMNLPSFGTTRGLPSDLDQDDTMDSFDDDEDSMFSLPTKMMANSFVLGKGKAENLEFEWDIAEWSACSQTCGGTGFQVRAVQCWVRLNNVSKTVDSTLCEDAGLPTPTTIQSCGYDDCPHWETAPWSECLDSQCFSWHTSHEKRAIFCRTSNGTDLPLSYCDEKTRPRRKRECYNNRCRSTWRVGEWSECTAQCSRQGFQSRILQCVWHGSTRPAGNACRDQQRPSVMRPCKGPPCQSNGNNCTDRSSYCSLAKTLHLCRFSRYHFQCCGSCRSWESKG